MKNLNKITLSIIIVLGLSIFANASYEDKVKEWKSYEDVEKWMKKEWSFDKSRQKDIFKFFKKEKKSGRDLRTLTLDEMALPAKEAYNSESGYCGDAASLIKDALNKVNPDYKARYIFIKNSKGMPHHWVTGFYVDGKLHVMDYGAGKKWSSMIGTFGPYDSLVDYEDFLSGLNLKSFGVETVIWRDRE